MVDFCDINVSVLAGGISLIFKHPNAATTADNSARLHTET